MKKRKEPSSAAQIMRPVLIGAVGGAVFGCIILLIAAAVMASVQVPDKAIKPIVYVTLSLATLCGGIVAARLSGQRGLLYGVGCGLLLFLVVALAGLGSETAVRGTSLLLKAVLSVGFGALGGVLGVNAKRRRRR